MIETQGDSLAVEKKRIQSFFCIPPLNFKCLILDDDTCTLEPFYSHTGGYKLQLLVSSKTQSYSLQHYFMPLVSIKYIFLESEFAVQLPHKLMITTKVIDQKEDEDHIVVKYEVASNKPAEWVRVINCMHKHHNNYSFIFRVMNVSAV